MNRLDILGLSSQDPNRVISFPASQSLHASTAVAALGNKAVSTGLPELDEAVTPPVDDELKGLEELQSKGLPCGHVAEVFGPPGAGKTSIALNTAATALAKGEQVVWIGPPLPRKRLAHLLTTLQPQSLSQIQNLTHIQTPTLPHLLSLLTHPPPTFPPPATTLLVIDSLSAPFTPYFPNPSDLQHHSKERSQTQWLLNRKWNVLADVATQLARLATVHALAVLVTNQTHTRIRGQVRATLCPVLAGSRAWEAVVFTRVGVYFDFVSGREWVGGEPLGFEGLNGLVKGRVVEVMKRGGRVVRGRCVGENLLVGVGVCADGLFVWDGARDPGEREGDLEVRVSDQREVEAPTVDGGDTTTLEPDDLDEPEEPAGAEDLEELERPPGSANWKRKAEEIADSQDEEDSEGELIDANSLDET